MPIGPPGISGCLLTTFCSFSNNLCAVLNRNKYTHLIGPAPILSIILACLMLLILLNMAKNEFKVLKW